MIKFYHTIGKNHTGRHPFNLKADQLCSQDNAGAYYAPAVVWSKSRPAWWQKSYQGKINEGNELSTRFELDAGKWLNLLPLPQSWSEIKKKWRPAHLALSRKTCTLFRFPSCLRRSWQDKVKSTEVSKVDQARQRHEQKVRSEFSPRPQRPVRV